jgi:hypothetical protein
LARLISYLQIVAGFSHGGAHYSSAHHVQRWRRAGVGGRERAQLVAADERRVARHSGHHLPPRRGAGTPFRLAGGLALKQTGLVPLDHAAQRVTPLRDTTEKPTI